MISEHNVIVESKEVLRKWKDGPCKRDTEINLKGHPVAKAGTIWSIK